MSDKVVVAIITTSGTLLVALIGWLSHKRKTQHQSETVPQTVIVTAPSIPIASHGTPQPVSRRKTDFSHKQISDAIEAVPPFQQDSIEASFVGVHVTWHGTLFGASRYKDSATVTLDDVCKDGGLCFCSASLQECDSLLIAPARAEIVVTGKIKRISKHEAHLEDCTFQILQKAVA